MLEPLLNCQCCFKFLGCGCTLKRILFLELVLPVNKINKYAWRRVPASGTYIVAFKKYARAGVGWVWLARL